MSPLTLAAVVVGGAAAAVSFLVVSEDESEREIFHANALGLRQSQDVGEVEWLARPVELHFLPTLA